MVEKMTSPVYALSAELELIAENAKLRALLVEIQSMCDRGESHAWIKRAVRKALAELAKE
jgi:hypothetical protein